MLFVDNGQCQRAKVTPFLNQGVGADGHLNLAGSQAGINLSPWRPPDAAGEQSHLDCPGLQQLAEPAVMLFGQNFGGSHQRCLGASAHGCQHGRGGDDCLSGADIPLQQTIHGHVTTHIR